MGMVGCFAAVNASKQLQLRQHPDEIDEYLHPDEGESVPPNYIEVDKAWHGIHYLITGSPDAGSEPLSLAVLGGREVGDEIGYGPARFITPDQVAAIAEALSAISESDFRSRFAPKAMKRADIYPNVIWERDGEEAVDYLVGNYRPLVEFYKAAARRGDGVIAWLS